MTICHCPCQLPPTPAVQGIALVGVQEAKPLETLKILNFKVPTNAKNPLLLFIFCCVLDMKSKENLLKFTHWCMIKIFQGGGAGVVTPSNPPPPYKQLCLYPPPVFRCFCKDPLMTPTPTTPLQASFTATPSPSTTLSPP